MSGLHVEFISVFLGTTVYGTKRTIMYVIHRVILTLNLKEFLIQQYNQQLGTI